MFFSVHAKKFITSNATKANFFHMPSFQRAKEAERSVGVPARYVCYCYSKCTVNGRYLLLRTWQNHMRSERIRLAAESSKSRMSTSPLLQAITMRAQGIQRTLAARHAAPDFVTPRGLYSHALRLSRLHGTWILTRLRNGVSSRRAIGITRGRIHGFDSGMEWLGFDEFHLSVC